MNSSLSRDSPRVGPRSAAPRESADRKPIRAASSGNHTSRRARAVSDAGNAQRATCPPAADSSDREQ